MSHPVHTSVEGEQGSALPSRFSPHRANGCLLRGFFSAAIFTFAVCVLFADGAVYNGSQAQHCHAV